MSVDRYAWWRGALLAHAAGRLIEGWDSPEAPFDGFYRYRFSKHHLWEPVAIFLDADGLQWALFGHGDAARMAEPINYWMGCAHNPVTEEQYRHAREWGVWHDTLLAAKREPEPGTPVTDVSKAAAIGPRRS